MICKVHGDSQKLSEGYYAVDDPGVAKAASPSSAPVKASRDPSRRLMQKAEEQIAFLVRACTDMRALRRVHAYFLKCPKFTCHSSAFGLSKILGHCALLPSGDFDYARRLFAQIPHPNVFSWNSMIRGSSLFLSTSREPICFYKQMLQKGFAKPNSFTLAFALKSCSNIPAPLEGCQLHSQVCRDMQEAKIRPDEVTMVSVISACAKAGALDLGRWVHAFLDKNKIKLDMELNTALLDMYAKCGSIDKAREVFDDMEERDTQAWSSMIVGLAIHGRAEDVLELFSCMEKEKVKPNVVTFIGILSSCAHRGLVAEGRQFWTTMHELGIEPYMEHYGCMVDLFCRAGLIEEAYKFVKTMPIFPNSVIWRTLLVGCKNKRVLDKGEIAAKQLLELDPTNAENYVLLSNMYALTSQWEKVSCLRKLMKVNRVKVVPGISSIEIDGYVHEFMVGDKLHSDIKEIKNVLEEISDRVRRAGHEPLTSVVLHDVVKEEKEISLCEHSERLAIAFGLLKTKAPVVIRVVKNLRVCGDCHEVTKIISKTFDREIIVRDRVRFHHFIGGMCSCSDFW